MQTLPRNGSYVQRRKMYIQLSHHYLKSKVPIEWNSDQPPTQERHRSIAKQIIEKEYIKRIYDLKMERKLKQMWNPEGRDMSIGKETNIIDQKEALTKQVQEFNTSKMTPTYNSKNNNPEYAEAQQPRTPSVSSKEGQSRNHLEHIQREGRYRERQQYESERGRQKEQSQSNNRGNYIADKQDRYAYNENPRMDRSYNQLERNRSDYPNQNNHHPSQMYRGESGLGSHPYRQPYYIAHPKYQPPYLEQNQYSYDVGRQFKPQYHPELPPGASNPRPFRNKLPDRLEEFLRQETKADRKSAIIVNMKDN